MIEVNKDDAHCPQGSRQQARLTSAPRITALRHHITRSRSLGNNGLGHDAYFVGNATA